MNNEILRICAQFRFAGEVENICELTAGLINNSYRVSCRNEAGEAREYVLQQINTYVFKKPEEVMSNVQKVTAHLHSAFARMGVDSSRRALRLIETVDGGNMYRDEQDRCWRAYDFITNAISRDSIDAPEEFKQVGKGFGNFQRMLFDFPAGELFDTIPDFHNTKKRYETFLAAVEADKAGRAGEIQEDIAFFAERREMMSSIVDMIASGEIPLRVTHNDTKMNNVMLDKDSGEAVCVVDLDTVMPGSALYDFGDAVRFGASTAAEDEADTTKISINMDLFRAFAEGFVPEVREALTRRELELLPLGVKVITCELAMRFLTDYLDGDLYFKQAYPGHNLVRARAQMKLLSEIENRYDQMCAVIQEMLGK